MAAPTPSLVVLAMALAIGVSMAVELDFSYADQKAWPMLPQSQCGGRRQSPIDLDLRHVTVNHAFGQRLSCTWQRLDAIIGGLVVNTGRTIELEVGAAHSCRGVPGSELSEFRLAKVHIHYSDKSGQGSEHTINGRASALEMHLVHFDTRFGTFENAALNPNGIMVVALLFDETLEVFGNCELAKLSVVSATALQKVRQPATLHLQSRNLLLGTGLHLHRQRFLAYRGSLTTPNCNEVVTWIVAAQPGLVGTHTLQLLRAAPGLNPGTKLAPNFRQLQPLNGRRVFASFKPPPEFVLIN